MKTAADFILTRADQLSRRYRTVRTARLLATGIFYGLLICLLLSILRQLRAVDFPIPLVFISIIVAAAASGLPAGIFRKIDFLSVLIAAERAWGLKERLSTAFELIGRGERNLYSSLLIEDAAERARNIVPRTVFPLAVSLTGKLIPLLVAVILILCFVDFNLHLPEWNRMGIDQEIAEKGKELEQLGKRLAARAERESMPESLNLAKELERLGGKLQTEKLTREEAGMRLSSLADKIESELGTIRMKMSSPSDRIGKGGTDKNNSSRTQKRDGAPGKEGEDSLDDSLTPDRFSDELQRQKGRQEMDALQELGDKLKESARSLAAIMEALPQTAEGAEESKQDEQSSKLAGPPGKTPAEDQEQAAGGDPKPSQGELTELKGEVGREDFVTALARSLPSISESNMPESEIIYYYKKQLEEALVKEDIPITLKEYIRDYFLLLGIEEE